MNIQTWITSALVLLSILYFFRASLKSALGKGCSSGCGSCQSGCPAKKLQEIQEKLDRMPPRKT